MHFIFIIDVINIIRTNIIIDIDYLFYYELFIIIIVTSLFIGKVVSEATVWFSGMLNEYMLQCSHSSIFVLFFLFHFFKVTERLMKMY